MRQRDKSETVGSTPSPAQALAKASGLDVGDIETIWAQVQENTRALKACVGPHEFKPDPLGPPKLGQKYKCALCGGTARAEHVHWYLAGLDHGTRFGIEMGQAVQKAEEPEAHRREGI